MSYQLTEEMRQVLGSQRRYCVEACDVLEYLNALPPDSVDLVVTSPPYGDLRSYGIEFKKSGEAWVEWMTQVATALSAVCKGLVAINCSGVTSTHSYDCAPELLTADLKRKGYTFRKGCIFHRWGTPGGAKDWWRNNWENVICLVRPGLLPYANLQAVGKPPKYKPGGKMSNRQKNGERAAPDAYVPPKIANPGNVVQQTYSAEQVSKLLDDRLGGKIEHTDFIQCVVGGGHMGSKLAHENEAPFPESLVYPFVATYCPPGGLVLDPFCGSGTTGAVALNHQRRFLGCDVRQSQVELTRRRLDNVNPVLFAE